MYVVYAIKNLVNQKIYIGVTNRDLTKRLREHFQEANRERAKKRKLYNEINTLGKNKFYIEPILKCDGKETGFMYEKFFIKKFDSVNNGLNESLGGAGKTFFEVEDIYKSFLKHRSYTLVAAEMGCCVDTVHNVIHQLKKDGYEIPDYIIYGSKVRGVDIETKEEFTFPSSGEAGRFCVEIGRCKRYTGGTRQKILYNCKGRLKSAFGFVWSFVD